MSVKARLRASQKTGEILSIAYFGGSRPGMARDVVVASVDGDTMRARCLDSGRLKTYFVDLVWLAEDTAAEHQLATDQNAVPQSPDFALAVAHVARLAEARGLVMVAATHAIAVHKRFKNGRVALEPLAVVREFVLEDGRPVVWSVTTRGGARTFPDLGSAVYALTVAVTSPRPDDLLPREAAPVSVWQRLTRWLGSRRRG